MSMEELQELVGSMTFQQATAAREAIGARIIELQTVKADELLERWRQEAAELGIDPEHLIGDRGRSKKKRRGRPRNGDAS